MLVYAAENLSNHKIKLDCDFSGSQGAAFSEESEQISRVIQPGKLEFITNVGGLPGAEGFSTSISTSAS